MYMRFYDEFLLTHAFPTRPSALLRTGPILPNLVLGVQSGLTESNGPI